MRVTSSLWYSAVSLFLRAMRSRLMAALRRGVDAGGQQGARVSGLCAGEGYGAAGYRG